MKIITDQKAKKIIKLIAENYIVALSLSKDAEHEDINDFISLVDHIQSSAIEAARLVGGIKGVEYINSIISKFHKYKFGV